jgi:hypothetical protein
VFAIQRLVLDRHLLQPFIMFLYFPSPCPHYKPLFNCSCSLSVQITAARHAIETDCGVTVATDVYSYCYILVVVDDPASRNGNTVS